MQFINPATNVVIATATTDINGAYSVNVPDGTYKVNVIYPTESGYAQSFDHSVIDDPNSANNNVLVFPVTGVDVAVGSTTTVSVYSNRVSTEVGTPPIAIAGGITNNRTDDNTVVLDVPMTSFTYRDASGNLATYLKITVLPIAGILKYNGSAVTLNQEITLAAGNLSYPITYESSQAIFLSHQSYVSFKIKTASSVDYSNEATLTIDNTAFNSNYVYAYLDTNGSQIKARSSCPDQAFIVDLTTYDVCWALLPSQVKTALSSSGDATWDALFALAIGTGEANKINHWSNFAPTEWYLSGGVLASRKKAVSDKRSAFAAYNHAAVGPSLVTYTPTYTPSLGDTGVSCTIGLGEINWGAISSVARVGIKTYNGALLLGSAYVALTAMNGESVFLSNVLNLSFSGTVTLTSEVFFCDMSNNRIADIPGVAGFSTTYQGTSVELFFTNTPTEYQATVITCAADAWTIVTKPDWITLTVYAAGIQITGGNPYLSGYTLRVSASTNTGVTRTGVIELSEGITINVSQQGADPVYSLDVIAPLVVTENFTHVIFGSTEVAFNFTLVSGIGATDADIVVDLRKSDGIGGYYVVGNPSTKTTRDGQIVNGTLTGLTTSDIGYGDVFLLHIETFA